MISIHDIIAYIEALCGHSLYPDEGLQVGRRETPVRSVLICWMATEKALEQAASVGAELVLGHESLYYPYNALIRKDNPEGWENWPVNRLRRMILEQNAIAFVRVHGTLDEICIYDDFRRQLQLPDAARADSTFIRRYDIEPCTLGQLVQHVKGCVGLDHVRVSAPKGLDQLVSRIGLLWGGVGLFVNVATQAKLLELDCDCLVAGESDDYGFRFAAEVGIPMIETSHEISENAGIERFRHMLGNQFPELTVHFYRNRCPWQWA